MQTRKWKLDTDYKYLVEWWKQYDFGTVPKECLPPDGIVVLLDRPICAAGLYLCKGTKFGFMEWVVVDKKIGLNDIGRIRIRTMNRLFYDAYHRNRITGSLIIVDEATNSTVGAGMIL